MANKPQSGIERRQSKRMVVQESFRIFLVVPTLFGMAKIYLRDISRGGLCFQPDMESDIQPNQVLSARLYMNPAFYLPIDCKVVRVHKGEIAVEFQNTKSTAVQAIGKLQDFLDLAVDSGVLVT